MPCSPGSRTFLLASLAPRIDDAVRPVGLAHTSAKGLTVATTARTTRFCRTHQRRSSARGYELTGTTRPVRTSRDDAVASTATRLAKRDDARSPLKVEPG